MTILQRAEAARRSSSVRQVTASRHQGGNLPPAPSAGLVGYVAPPWWGNPAILMAGFIIPMYTLVYSVPALFGTGAMQLRAPIFFEQRYFWLGLIFLFCALLGCTAGQFIQPGPPRPGHKQEEYISTRYLELVALLTIGAYFIWFRDIFTSPSALISVLRGDGAYGNIRSQNKTIGGITTLAQCGLSYMIFYTDRVWGLKQPLPHWRFTAYFYTIIGLAVFRSYAWSERLATIELVVPLGLLYFCYRDRGTLAIMRVIRAVGPVLGLALLIGYFGMMEFFRSWTAYEGSESGFWSFVMRRFLSYYYGALNNGAGLLMVMDWPTYNMEHVIQWLYRFPALIGPIFRFAFDVQTQDFIFLSKYADSEFNNMSGIFTIFFDMGVAGALLYAGVWGLIAGASYASVKARRGFLRLLFPLMFLSILEIMRILYLGDVRAFPIVLTLVLGYALFRERVAVPAQPHQIRRARRHRLETGGRWYRPRVGRFFGR